MILNLSTLLLTQAAPAGASPNTLASLVPMFFIGVIFYFLLIRPQQKQRKEHQALITALKTGDKVITSSGIHGMIANVKEKTFVVKVADNVKIEFDKASVTSIQKDSEEESSEKKVLN